MTQHKERLIRFANDELLGKGNFDIVETAFTADYVAHSSDGNFKGYAFVQRFIKLLRLAIPDIQVVNIEVLVQKEDTAVWQRTLTGTHKTNMMGIPPSMQKVVWKEMLVSRFEGDKIAEEWIASELLGQLLVKIPRR